MNDCKACDGRGEIEDWDLGEDGELVIDGHWTCDVCDGKGWTQAPMECCEHGYTLDEYCWACDTETF